MFSGGRAPEASYADMIVSIPPDADRKIGEVQWPQQLPGNPAVDFVTLKAEIIDKDQAITTFSRPLRQSQKKEGRWSSSMASTSASKTRFTASRKSCTIQEPRQTSLRFSSPGHRKAISSPTPMTAIARIILATLSNRFCDIWRRIRKSKKSPFWPILFTTNAGHASNGSKRARARSNGHGSHVGRSPPLRFGFSFMRWPTISVIFCARWRRRSRSKIGSLTSL